MICFSQVEKRLPKEISAEISRVAGECGKLWPRSHLTHLSPARIPIYTAGTAAAESPSLLLGEKLREGEEKESGSCTELP